MGCCRGLDGQATVLAGNWLGVGKAVRHLAQMNVGRTVDAMDSPAMAGFAQRLAAVNALADAAPGFVWPLQGESGNATDILPTYEPRFLVNMSVVFPPPVPGVVRDSEPEPFCVGWR